MHILAISDLHGFLPEIPPCDLLLLGGDYNKARDRDMQLRFMNGEFRDWLHNIEARYIVGIAGNHDFVLEEWPDLLHNLPWKYLKDETIDIEGVKIHGSPWTPEYGNWAFMKPDYRLIDYWNKIPEGLDILLTHGPAYRYGDETMTGEHAGSRYLTAAIKMKQPNSHVFGHIHEAHGIEDDGTTRYFNVAHVNFRYEPVNGPVNIPLKV